jgi:hypothetical protein
MDKRLKHLNALRSFESAARQKTYSIAISILPFVLVKASNLTPHKA